jgi:hypothetical protein
VLGASTDAGVFDQGLKFRICYIVGCLDAN